MKIVTDDKIPYVTDAFGPLGEIVTLPGRSIGRSAVAGADVLLVRTLTRVDRNLLEGSSVRFVATATIGYDHVDTEYLQSAGIGFASAAGCNANSVAEYLVAAILHLARTYGFSPADKTIGIVGVGNVGSRVVEKAKILGMSVLQNDPPLARRTGDRKYASLDDVLAGSDFVSLHVPLTRDGEDATFHMGDDGFLKKMKREAFLINTSRGPVVDGAALLCALQADTIAGAILDVWEGEPDIDTELLERTDIGTPHIAGYSRDGKANATLLIYSAVCDFLKVPPAWCPTDLPPPANPIIDGGTLDGSQIAVLAGIVEKAYPIMNDDAELRKIGGIATDLRGHYFDTLRNEYPVRREFHSMRVMLKNPNDLLKRQLQDLGFTVIGN
jgi:erythronate-4-phosphate dehydrogenase